jgi:lauroyl/myristoyl acyltransferase
MRVLSADAYPRDIYRCFQGGYVLGAALDVHRVRDERKRTACVRLFGQQRDFLVGTVQIALRCGAEVLQGFVVSEKNFQYRLDLLGPLVADPSAADSPERLGEVMQTYADNIESHLRRYPDHLSRV